MNIIANLLRRNNIIVNSLSLFKSCILPHSGPTLSSSSSERLDDHLLSSTIDVSVVKHKYALLDVCQRLPASAMTDFSQRLGLPLEKVRQITSDFTMQEERYYQVYTPISLECICALV